MVLQENSQHSLAEVQEQEFTPEPFSPPWNGDRVDILEIPLNFPYSSKEWDKIFATLLDLLQHEECHIWRRAIDRLVQALEIEESQHSNCDDYKPRPTQERLNSIFAAIVTQSLSQPKIFETFCSRFHFLAEKLPYNLLVLEWLDQLATSEDRKAPTAEEILAAQIFLGAYSSTWQEVGVTLFNLLDHTDLSVRACAAYQIGKFSSTASYSRDEVWEWSLDQEKYERDKQSVVGMPPLEIIMQLIRTKELERSGVAGAFWNASPKEGFDAKEWLLSLLENSSDPEPYIPYFPCNLSFDVHERFSRDPDAVGRLMDMGRVSLACITAIDESYKVAALEPLLIELGYSDDPEIVRLASWHLAYYYHYFHPKGAKLGWVERVNEFTEFDLFLLFSSRQENQPLYAVVMYPKVKNQQINRAVAQRWVDQIFPPAIRGKIREDLQPNWYQRGFVEYHVSAQGGAVYRPSSEQSDLIEHVIIGYRSELPWNPKDFLEQWQFSSV